MITSILEIIYYLLKLAPKNSLFYSYYFYEQIRGLSGENNSLGTKISSSLLFIQFHPLIDCLHKASFVSNLSLVILDFPLGMPEAEAGNWQGSTKRFDLDTGKVVSRRIIGDELP